MIGWIRRNLKRCPLVLMISLSPVLTTHLIYYLDVTYDDIIRIICFAFVVLLMPPVLFFYYQKIMSENDGKKNILPFLCTLIQTYLTIFALDGEGTMTYKELNGGEGMQIVLAMIAIASGVLLLCAVLSIVYQILLKN